MATQSLSLEAAAPRRVSNLSRGATYGGDVSTIDMENIEEDENIEENIRATRIDEPATATISFKPLIRSRTRALNQAKERIFGSESSESDFKTEQTESDRPKIGIVRALTCALGLADDDSTKKKKKMLGAKTISLDDLRDIIAQNLVEEHKRTLFDYYKKEGIWQAIAKSRSFEYASLVVICINAIWMAIDTNRNKADSLIDAHPVFIVAENCFCAYFSVEWFIRFMAFRRKVDGLKDAWFVFDSLLAGMMVMETWVLSAIMLILNDQNLSMGGLAILRLFRLLRLTRLARMLRALPELMIIVKGALRAMRSVFFVIGLLFAITYVFSIALVLLTKGTDSKEYYFSSVPHGVYSLLLYGTLLDNMVVVVTQLGEDNPISVVVFFIYVCLAALTVLNMLIGVLCEMVSMVAANEKERILTTTAQEKLYMVVNELDENEDHQLSKSEFLDILVNPIAAQALNDIGIDPVGVVDFADVIFSDEQGQETELNFEEFMEVILQLRGNNSSTVRHMIELKHMIKEQLDDLTSSLKVEEEKTSRRPSLVPLDTPKSHLAPPGGDDMSRRNSLTVGDGASASSPMAWAWPKQTDSEGGPPRMFAAVTQEDAPELLSPTRRSSLDSSRRGSDAGIVDETDELNLLQQRTERVEDMVTTIFAELKKLSSQLEEAEEEPPSDDEPNTLPAEACVRTTELLLPLDPCADTPHGHPCIPGAPMST